MTGLPMQFFRLEGIAIPRYISASGAIKRWMFIIESGVNRIHTDDISKFGPFWRPVTVGLMVDYQHPRITIRCIAAGGKTAAVC